MTVKIKTDTYGTNDIHETPEVDQAHAWIYWKSRGKWYAISGVTVTHNPEYPTPTINVTAPNAGIGFRVTDSDGKLLFTTRKEKGNE